MDILPNEILDLIFSFLSKNDIATARHVCGRFRRAGEDYLFANFEYRLLPRMEIWHQLHAISKSQNIRVRVKTLCFESGIPLEYANYRYWKENLQREMSFEFPQQMSTQEYNRRHRQLEAKFPPELAEVYEKYRLLLDDDSEYFALPPFEEELKAVIRRLPNLQNLRLQMREPRIRLQDLANNVKRLESFNPVKSHPREKALLRRAWCVRHFLACMSAAWEMHMPVTSFEGDRLPYALLAAPEFQRDRAVLSDVHTLSISLSPFPYSDWLERTPEMTGIWNTGEWNSGPSAGRIIEQLSRTLRAAKSPVSLSLKFPSLIITPHENDLFDGINTRLLPSLHFPGLRFLELKDFDLKYATFMDFLASHKATLTHLTLTEGFLELADQSFGSWIDVFNILQSSFNLHNVALKGTLRLDRQEPYYVELWHSHDEHDFSICIENDGSYPFHGLRSQIETFVVHGGPCPLPTPKFAAETDIWRTWELLEDASFHMANARY